MPKSNIINPAVKSVFDAYPKKISAKLMTLRRLILKVARESSGVGVLEETLRWGQPSYLTTETKSGSMIRIDQLKSRHEYYAMYFHCQTTLVATFKEIYPTEFKYEGNRSIVFRLDDKVPVEELSDCILMALTYHRNKQKK